MLIGISFQIVTGIFLVCFIAQMHISLFKCRTLMRDVLMDGLYVTSCQWRFFFFIVVYAHLFRGLYYGSYFYPTSFMVLGVIILLLMIITSFQVMYYMGTNELWAATLLLIQLYCTFFGQKIVNWYGVVFLWIILLSKFFSLHYIYLLYFSFCFITSSFIHQAGSNTPSGWRRSIDEIHFILIIH